MRDDRHIILEQLIRDDYELFYRDVLEHLPANAIDKNKVSEMTRSSNPKVVAGGILLLLEYFSADIENRDLISYASFSCCETHRAATGEIFLRLTEGDMSDCELNVITLITWLGFCDKEIRPEILKTLHRISVDKIQASDLNPFLGASDSAYYEGAMIVQNRLPENKVKAVLEAFR